MTKKFSEQRSKFYITTTIPYVNDKPHVGFALEVIQADALARFHSLLGEDVIFSTGTDEHGIKIYRKAQEVDKDPQNYVDEFAQKFATLKETLNLSYTNFIRTTSPEHIKAAQKFWELCNEAGDIYKKNYKTKYCTGCELEKTDSELEEGKCPLHPKLEIEIIEEENYFFRFSKYQDKLLEYVSNSTIVPTIRKNEAEKFIKKGLVDFSISRLKEKMPWGVPVPGDSEHVMYVWFDALVNYISTLGWPNENSDFEDYWVNGFNIQCAGKDQVRMQSIMWQAMLMSAKLAPTKQVFYHGFITSGGQKMSKSLGNVIDPIEYVEKYGADALRYYLLAKMSPTQDSDFTQEKFEQVYNADLANGLGNLVARIARLSELNEFSIDKHTDNEIHVLEDSMNNYRFDDALNTVWEKIKSTDATINKVTLWENTADKLDVLEECIREINTIASWLEPFLPDTAAKIKKQFNGKITSGDPLFPRLK